MTLATINLCFLTMWVSNMSFFSFLLNISIYFLIAGVLVANFTKKPVAE
jgi:hypothetical protein